jgi:hypothetical protein
MPFAQQNYSQGLGNSTNVTISEAGCLLTSICNGLERMNGSAPDPVTLNNFFINNGVYTWDSIDQAADDLNWDSISKFDPTISFTGSGQGSVPPSNNAIVKFHYNGVHSGLPIDHYCWVDHVEGNDVYIIDPWDGQVKGPSGYQNVYHLPVAWGTYVKNSPQPPAPKYTVVEVYDTGKLVQLNKQPTNLWGMNYDFDYMKDHPVEVHNQGEIQTVTNKVRHQNGYDYYRRDGQIDGFNVLDCDDYTPPPPRPPDAPLPIPTSTEPYEIVKTIMGFATSNSAANHTDAKAIVDAGTYYVFNTRANSDGKVIALNVTKTTGKPGSWINPDDNVVDPEPPKAQPVTVEQIIQNRTPDSYKEPETTPVTVTVKPPSPDAWKKMTPLNEDRVPELYISMNKTEIHIRDFEQKRSPLPLEPLSSLHIIGTFTKDGVIYGRTAKIAKEGLWYGIPMTILESAEYKGIRFTDYFTLFKYKLNKLIHDVRF